jgi:hypothetical protein
MAASRIFPNPNCCCAASQWRHFAAASPGYDDGELRCSLDQSIASGREKHIAMAMTWQRWGISARARPVENGAETECSVALVYGFDVNEMFSQRPLQPLWQHRHTVLHSFAVAHDDTAVAEITLAWLISFSLGENDTHRQSNSPVLLLVCGSATNPSNFYRGVAAQICL